MTEALSTMARAYRSVVAAVRWFRQFRAGGWGGGSAIEVPA